MAYFVSKEGVWDVTPGGRSSTPVLKVAGLQPGTFVKVTCNFGARTIYRDTAEGFFYSLGTDGDNDVLAMTPATAIFQGDDGWQSCSLMTVFRVLATTDGEVDFACHFSKGDLSGSGALMNFVMIAEILHD